MIWVMDGISLYVYTAFFCSRDVLIWKCVFKLLFSFLDIFHFILMCLFSIIQLCCCNLLHILVGKMDVHIFSWLFLLFLFMCCYKQSKTQFSCNVQTWIRRAIKNWRLIINASKIWSCRKLWLRIINYIMVEQMVFSSRLNAAT